MATSGGDGTAESATKSCNVSIKPKQPASFTAAPGNAEVTLSWTAIAGVSGWEVKQGSGSWTAISSSDATTASHTVTGLTNGTEYTFKARAFVGGGNTLVNGVESDAKTVTPLADLVPILTDIADRTYTQDTAITDFMLPEATGGDEGSIHPAYTYTLTPDVSGIGLTFNADDRLLSGTPAGPSAKVAYTYTATETNDDDGANESGSKTFTIGVRPKKPENFSATAGNAEVMLRWTAIPGVDHWYYLLQGDPGGWTKIAGADGNTNSHTVTGLTNGTEYTFRILSAVGATEDVTVASPYSESVSVTPIAGITQPVKPTGFTVVVDKTGIQPPARPRSPAAAGRPSRPPSPATSASSPSSRRTSRRPQLAGR